MGSGASKNRNQNSQPVKTIAGPPAEAKTGPQPQESFDRSQFIPTKFQQMEMKRNGGKMPLSPVQSPRETKKETKAIVEEKSGKEESFDRTQFIPTKFQQRENNPNIKITSPQSNYDTIGDLRTSTESVPPPNYARIPPKITAADLGYQNIPDFDDNETEDEEAEETEEQLSTSPYDMGYQNIPDFGNFLIQ